MSETVYVAARRTGGNSGHFHTDEDCEKLQAAERVHEYQRGNIEHMRELCSVCAGEVRHGDSQRTAAYRAARDADPSEVGD